MPCGSASPLLKKKPEAFRTSNPHLAWLCYCPEQTPGSPQVAAEICPGTPGRGRSVAAEEQRRRQNRRSVTGDQVTNRTPGRIGAHQLNTFEAGLKLTNVAKKHGHFKVSNY